MEKYQNAEDKKSVPKPRLKFNFPRIVEIAAHRSAAFLHPLYSQSLKRTASEKSTRIIIALKHYKEKNNRWPDTLEQLGDLITDDNLIDPTNGQPFVYKPADQSFMLYSKGKNKIDDDGIQFSQQGKDDDLIWPLLHPLLSSPPQTE